MQPLIYVICSMHSLQDCKSIVLVLPVNHWMVTGWTSGRVDNQGSLRRHILLHNHNTQYTSARVLNINFKSERAGTPKISITEIRYNKK